MGNKKRVAKRRYRRAEPLVLQNRLDAMFSMIAAMVETRPRPVQIRMSDSLARIIQELPGNLNMTRKILVLVAMGLKPYIEALHEGDSRVVEQYIHLFTDFNKSWKGIMDRHHRGKR